MAFLKIIFLVILVMMPCFLIVLNSYRHKKIISNLSAKDEYHQFVNSLIESMNDIKDPKVSNDLCSYLLENVLNNKFYIESPPDLNDLKVRIYKKFGDHLPDLKNEMVTKNRESKINSILK